jgi:hypothetical protein
VIAVPAYRTFTESLSHVESAKVSLAGAGFHTEQFYRQGVAQQRPLLIPTDAPLSCHNSPIIFVTADSSCVPLCLV